MMKINSKDGFSSQNTNSEVRRKVETSQQEHFAEKKVRFSTPDNWDLIEHIGKMQSVNPLRSMKELVDNAIDAFARDPSFTPAQGKKVGINIGKQRVSGHIKIVDNGLGWEYNPSSGFPNFEYSVGHIGDSIKKYLKVFQKARAEGISIGQYALGLLSFWALGKRLTIFSRSRLPNGTISPCSKMIWLRYNREASIVHGVSPPPELEEHSGCVVIVDQLEKARMNLVSGNSLQKYLARTCRTRLMKTKVDVEICYRGQKFHVKPMKYEGKPFPVSKYHTEGGFGDIELEIYLFPPAIDPEEYKVPVFSKGAKVYDDITQIEELDIYPWNAKKVYGQIDYPYGSISPSRNAFINDSFMDAFIVSMKKITERLSKQIEEIEARKRKWQKKRFYTAFQKTWREILNNLPEEWRREKEGKEDKITTERKKSEKHKVEAGPLYRIEISPQNPQVQCRTIQSFTAKAYDVNENLISDPEMIYYWKIEPSAAGNLARDQFKTCIFQAGKKERIATITVTAFQYVEEGGKEKTIVKTASTNIWVVIHISKKPPNPPRGDKPPSLEELPLGNETHSKFLPKMNVVQVNNSHKDYKTAAEKGTETLIKYVNYCYCKEIAVDRWKDLTDPHELSERIIDLLAISEVVFDWKAMTRKPRGRPPKSART